jgi:hypothetical protein
LDLHAGNLREPAALAGRLDLDGERLLSDDYAPLDTLVSAAALAE